MKTTWMKWITVLLAILMVLPVMVACDNNAVAKDPEVAVKEALELSVDSVSDSDMALFFQKVSAGGSFELNFDMTGLTQMMQWGLSSALCMNIKTYGMDGGKSAAMTLEALYGGESLIGMQMFTDTENMIITSEELLGDQAIGQKVFYSTDTQLQETFDMAQLAQMGKLLSNYWDLLLDRAFELCTSSRTEGEVTIDGQTVKAVTVELSVTAQQAKAVASALYEAYKQDADAKALVEAMMRLYGGMDDAAIAQTYAELEASLSEEWEDEDTVVHFAFVLNQKEGNLMQLKLSEQEDGQTTDMMVLTTGVDAKNPSYVALEMPSEKVFLTYRVSENTQKAYAMSVSLVIEGREQLKMDVNLDKASGEYELAATVQSNAVQTVTMNVEGTYQRTKDTMVITVDSVGAMGISLDLDLTMTFRANDTCPLRVPTDYTDLNAMSEEQAMTFSYEIMENAQAWVMQLPTEIQTVIQMLLMGQ